MPQAILRATLALRTPEERHEALEGLDEALGALDLFGYIAA